MNANPLLKDCIIVGGGPAGLSAALYLARFLRRVTVFDAQEGRARMIPETHNFPPFPEGVSGQELVERMQSHAELYGAVFKKGTVVAVERREDVFLVTTDQQTEKARTVILATGVFNHRPPLSRQDHDRGLARGLIRYCPVCDAFEVRGRRVAVLGHGAHGLDEAHFVRTYSATVTLIPADGTVAAPEQGIGVLQSPMTAMSLSEEHVVVTLANGGTERFDTLYVALGTTAQSGLAKKLGVLLDDSGCVKVDAMQRTNIEQVYAIGDVTDALDQIAVAMGQGAIAATAIHNDLPR